MAAVGVRELKSRLSAYLRQVQAGGALQVTDRGKVIAEIVPAGWSSEMVVPPAVAALARQGKVRLPSLPRSPLVGATRKRGGLRLPPGTAQRLLDADRGER